MSKTNSMLLIIGLISSLVLFQNCGGFNSSETESLSSSGPLGPQGETELFKAGDPFDSSLIPYSVTSKLSLALQNYGARQGFKVVVLTPKGEGLAGGDKTSTSQAEVTQIFLERCQLEFNNQPCAVFAEGDLIKYDESVFYNSHQFVIEDQVTFNPLKVPTWAYKWRNESKYIADLANNTYQAMALGIEGAVSSGWSNVSQEDANTRALEMCEALVDHPCVLYAVGMTVVFKAGPIVWGPKIVEFGPKLLDINKIPFVSDAKITQTAVPMLDRMNATGKHSVVALSRWGHWYHIESNSPITQAQRDSALAQCTAQITPHNDPARFQPVCFIYSVDFQVELTKEAFRLASFGS